MKIALICTEKLPVPAVAGGAIQIYIDGIVPYLSKIHEVTVFCVEHPALPSEETRDNVRYIRVPAGKKYLDGVKQRLSNDFDLVHIFNRPKSVVPLSENLPGTRFSLSLHNEMFRPDKISGDDAAKCIERVEFINTVSKFIAEGVEKLYPAAASKLNVVYSGADTSAYKTCRSEEGLSNRAELEKRYNLEGYKVVLFVGRLSVKKGVHILLKAMKKVMDSRPDVALAIIGSKRFGSNETDEYTQMLGELAKELKNPVVSSGFVPPAEIPAFYNLGDVFVCSSQWNEPLARVHYEAMAAGLPIITTNRGGNAEVVTHCLNGLVVDDYRNPDVFAEYINLLLDDPAKAAEMGAAGRRLAEEKYTWERVAGEVFKPLLP